MTLGELIKLTRKQKDMTQPELAAAAQIEQSYLSKLENDKCTPSFEVIQKVAKALGQDPMAMINQLSREYASQKLAHIPEVVAECAALKAQQTQNLKKRFIYAAAVVVLGMGLFMVGQLSLLFPEMAYTYRSDGVIKAGETPMQYDDVIIHQIGETKEESQARLKSNASRFDRQFLHFDIKQPSDFFREEKNGRRYYKYQGRYETLDIRNSLVAILGIMVMVSGCFGFWYVFRFKP